MRTAFWLGFDRPDPTPPPFPDPPGRSLAGVHPILADRIRRVHARHPVRVNSGHRSSQDQQLFWDCAQAKASTGRCPPGCERSACASAHRPGDSNHEAEPFGPAAALAVDMEPLDGDVATFQAVCRSEGLHFPISKEWWHAEPVENPTPGGWGGFPPGW